MPFMLNGFLLLAIVASALGVVNTTLLSVTERRRELGQVRALGGTRAQVRAIVVGEAALTGFVGGAAGLLAGSGLLLAFAAVYGGASMGVAGYQPLAALWTGLQPAWLGGGVSLILAPLGWGAAARV